MWNMMCDVMPTISEDSISQRQFAGDSENFESLMVNMLDERDKLMETLRETQDQVTDLKNKLAEVEKERDSLQRQLNANMPQVSTSPHCPFSHLSLTCTGVHESDPGAESGARKHFGEGGGDRGAESGEEQHPAAAGAFGVSGFTTRAIAENDGREAAGAVPGRRLL